MGSYADMFDSSLISIRLRVVTKKEYIMPSPVSSSSNTVTDKCTIVMLVVISLLALSATTFASPIVGGYPADPPRKFATTPRNVPVVTTSTRSPNRITTTFRSVSFTQPPSFEPPLASVVSALTNITVTGLQLPGILAFLGLRYAEAPVGGRRFQRPTRLRMSDNMDCTTYGPPCPQLKDKQVVGNEDCLYLNIYTPDTGLEKGGLPVLFWIHGGHYQSGSASQYNPERLVKKGMIVVTPQYRLGSLGFLSLGMEELPGNAGLFDVGAALMWTKENIKHFGGDPNRIIPAGQGSGASLATFLAVNPVTSPIIQGLICLSGSALSPFAVDKTELNTANKVSKADGCSESKGVDFIRCMQEIPLESIVKGDLTLKEDKDIVQSVASINAPGPAEEGISDNRFLPSFHSIPVLDAIKQGLFPNIPLLTGVTNKETCGAVKGDLLGSFTNKLKTPSFLNKNILKDLLKVNTGLYSNRSANPNLTNLFNSDSYLKSFGLLTQPLTALEKVVELTTDALFNLPVFVVSHLWQKKGRVYLYSLDDPPRKSLAYNFLPNLILGNRSQDRDPPTGAQHGDDLGLMFKPQDIFGNPIPGGNIDKDDISVSEYYINMVYEFARTGIPKLKPGTLWMPFSPDKNNYMSITRRDPKEKANFNKCEMGLWTGNANILKSVECSIVGEAAKTVMDILGGTGTGLLTAVKSSTDSLTSGLSEVTKPLETGLNNLETGLSNATKPLETGLKNVTDTLERDLTRPLTDLLGVSRPRDRPKPQPPVHNRNLLGDLGGILG